MLSRIRYSIRKTLASVGSFMIVKKLGEDLTRDLDLPYFDGSCEAITNARL